MSEGNGLRNPCPAYAGSFCLCNSIAWLQRYL
jgi:hypothetical protein